jgi:hypothetical protein
LDLADLPEVPSVFRPDRHDLIHPLKFLHAFAQDIVQPISRDGREHIEYVPPRSRPSSSAASSAMRREAR